MRINGVEYGFVYDVDAYVRFNDFVAKNSSISVVHARIMQAIYMSESYCNANGGDPLNAEVIKRMPKYVYDELINEIDAVIARDSERQVELEENPKNAKSTTKKRQV